MTLEETIEKIGKPDSNAMRAAQRRWDSIAKPLHSLGKLEDILVQIAGITGKQEIEIHKKALVTMCADNGVVEEGVTQTGQEVTAIVAENFLSGQATAAVLCKECGADIYPFDLGMASDTKVCADYKIAYGTKNMAKEPAMTREEAVRALEAGISIAERMKEKGYQILATGEMGIGNTTTSSAVASVLLSRPAETMTGRGAGLTTAGLEKKIETIQKAVSMHHPNPEDPVDVLAKVGGFDLCAMAGVCLGGAALGIPVVLDGFISCVSGLAAVCMKRETADYLIASHVSREPAAELILKELGKEAFLHADMCLGEGTGAVAVFPILDLAVSVYNKMSTFQDISVEQYQELK